MGGGVRGHYAHVRKNVSFGVFIYLFMYLILLYPDQSVNLHIFDGSKLDPKYITKKERLFRYIIIFGIEYGFFPQNILHAGVNFGQIVHGCQHMQ